MTDISEPPLYWAFISYSHHDEDWAAWLHRALETYRIPPALVGKRREQEEIPRRLFPVFRDRDELPGSPDLSQEIERALGRSRCLVVVCSPHAASSRYVAEEINRFTILGRADRILSIIVAGEPGASDGHGPSDHECFPEPLRSGGGGAGNVNGAPPRAPLASDVRPGGDGRRNALLKLVAGILGVGFDELLQRDRRRRRLLKWRIGMIALACVSILTASYIALSDADVVLPGSESTRTWLDEHGMTIFRPIATDAAIREAAHNARGQLLRRVLELQRPDGLFSWRIAGTPEGDTWTSMQVLAALLSATELGSEHGPRAMAAFDRLSAEYVVRDKDGVAGWLFEVGRPPHGGVALWAVSALARARQRPDLFSETQRVRLLAYYDIALKAAAQLHPIQGGGWNMYKNQDQAGAHNAYSTVLALQALLDVRRSGLPWIKGDPLPRLIEEAAAWLMLNYAGTRQNPGWAAFPSSVPESERDVLDGLTLQVYATLLRAEAEAGVELPVELVAAITRHLILAGRRPPDYRKDEADFAIMVGGRSEKEGVQFTWYPWAAQASALWLDRAKRKPVSRAEMQGVRRTLAHIVANPDARFVAHSVDPDRKAYEAAEFLFCLSLIR